MFRALKRTGFKLLAMLIICALSASFFIGCAQNDYAADKANEIKSEIIEAFNWFKEYYDLEKTDDLSKLPATEIGWSLNKQLNSNSLRILTIAKKLGLSADYDAFYNKLAVEFEEVEGVAITSANTLIRFLHAIDKDATSFCGHNLERQYVYGNESLIDSTDAYTLPYVLITFKEVSVPNDALYTADELVDLLVALQTEDGLWGWSSNDVINPEADYTAMAMSALSGYESASATNSLNKALGGYAALRNTDGTYSTTYTNASGTALMLSTFAGLKKDVFKSAAEDRTDPLSALKLFKSDDGGFKSSLDDDAESDGFATIDAIEAMFSTYQYYKSFVK